MSANLLLLVPGGYLMKEKVTTKITQTNFKYYYSLEELNVGCINGKNRHYGVSTIKISTRLMSPRQPLQH